MPTTKHADKRDLGYINIRITKKAHRELLKRALDDRRTIMAQLEIILGV